MKIPYFEVHSFTEKAGGGNPAGVCPLESWLPEDQMQKIAAEKNLSETAFFVREETRVRLRWFAPTVEVDLCGHATLAAAHILFEYLGFPGSHIPFHSKSGRLGITRSGRVYTMDFPSLPFESVPAPGPLLKGLKSEPREVLKSMDYLAVFSSEEQVRSLKPDLEELKQLDLRGVAVTAPGQDSAYVCRCFVPKIGIDEDPATGSIQCALTPFWSQKQGKTRFNVSQLSPRGGLMSCELKGGRVFISGSAVLHRQDQLSV